MATRILDVVNENAYVNDIYLWKRVLIDVANNNTYCPDISRILFNVGERDVKKNGKKVGTEPTLATTIFFKDNTKITCLNSEHDKITLVKDPETGVMTASDVDKERGIVYCTVKKLVSTIDPNTNEMKTEGFGRILRELVAMGWDQKVQAKKALLQKAKNKADDQIKRESKVKSVKNASLHDTVNRLADVVEKLNTKLDTKVSEENKASKPDPKKVDSKKQAYKVQKRNAKGQFI